MEMSRDGICACDHARHRKGRKRRVGAGAPKGKEAVTAKWESLTAGIKQVSLKAAHIEG